MTAKALCLPCESQTPFTQNLCESCLCISYHTHTHTSANLRTVLWYTLGYLRRRREDHTTTTTTTTTTTYYYCRQ